MESHLPEASGARIEGLAPEAARLLAGFDVAQRRFCDEAATLIQTFGDDALLTQMAELHLALTARLLTTQVGVLRVVAGIQSEVATIEARAEGASDVHGDEWLGEVFTDIADRERATRRRLESLSGSLRHDATTSAELASVLAEARAVSVSGSHEREAMDRLLDDLWCSARALRRSVVDDAHARVVIAERIAALQPETAAESVMVVTDPAVPAHSALESISATLRAAHPANLREVLNSLLGAIPAPTPAPSPELEPVTDEPIFRFTDGDWKVDVAVQAIEPEQRNFWAVESSARRRRLGWVRSGTPELQATA